MDLFGRTNKLEIYGPKGVQDVIEKVITTGHFVLEGFDLEINEIKPKGVTQIYADNELRIKCATLDHSVPCLGFSFEEREKRHFNKKKALRLGVPEGPMFSKLQAGEDVKVNGKKVKADDVLGKAIPGRKATYISDSRPCAAAVELSKGSDVLIHDSTFAHELQESALIGKHTTAKEAAQIAKRAKVKQLYLTHISQRYSKPLELEKEAKEVFSNTKIASDFDIVTL
jgi:ribonuclease Z